ncbi:uncharacterized protein DDB_G0287625-like [Ischnura elegans]|uniref:uncharacterized protein DDB_G0287625-like n=1 Tax=Ischnura elegans TaxID=197161 RepID=UPI001ED86A6D|nr:uncharacterized protein DDB_G0287625-like [Ischnura elegans]
MSSNCDDGETDIYGDLPNFQFDEAFKKLELDKAELQNKVEVLAAKLEEMKKENEKLSAKVRALGKNISCLYKTAQREIERKEEIIAQLRRERDDLLFRRGMQDFKPSNVKNRTKKPSRKQLTPTKKVRNGGLKKVLDGKGKSEDVNDGRITPSAEEYNQITGLSSGSPEKGKTMLNGEVCSTHEVINIDSGSNTDCAKDGKSLKEVKKTESSVVQCTSSVSNEVMVQENKRNHHSDDSKPGKTKDRKPVTVSPVKVTEAAKETEKETTVNSSAKSVNDVVKNDLKVTNKTQERVPGSGKSPGCLNNNKNVEITSPIKDKISVHMSSEDCGFGRRRVIRVIKPSLSPAVATSTTATTAVTTTATAVTTPAATTTAAPAATTTTAAATTTTAAATTTTTAATAATTTIPAATTTATPAASTVATISVTNPSIPTRTERGVKRLHEETVAADRETLRQPQLLAVEFKQDDPRVQKRRCVEGVSASRDQDIEHENVVDDNGVESKECRLGIQTGSCGLTNSDDLKVLRYDDTAGKNITQAGSGCEFKKNGRQVVKRTNEDKFNEVNEKATDDGGEKMIRDIVKEYSSSFGITAYEETANCHTHGSEVFSPDESDGEGTARKPKTNSASSIYSKERDHSRKGENFHGSKDCITSPRSSHSPSSGIRSPTRLSSCGRMTDEEPSNRRSWDRERVIEPNPYGGRRRHATGGASRAPHSQKGWDANEGLRDREYWDPSGRETVVARQSREDAPRERNGEPERGPPRGRDKSRDYGRDRSRGRSEDRVRDRSWDRSLDRSRARERIRGGKVVRGRSRVRKRDRSWDRDRRRSRDGSREHDRRRSRERSHEREKRNRDYDGEREWMRSERERGYDRARDPESRIDWEEEKVRIFNMGRNSVLAEKNRGPDLDQSRVPERGRETSQGSKESDGSRDGGRGRDRRNVNSYGSRSTDSSPGVDERRGSHQTKGGGEPHNSGYGVRKKLNDSNDTGKDSDHNRDVGRDRENRNVSSCRSQNVGGVRRRSEGKGSVKLNEKPNDGHYDLRKKLMETNSSSRNGVKRDRNGYKDLDQPSNEAIGNLASSGPIKAKRQEPSGIRSPEDKKKSDPREVITYASEWD